MKKITFGIVLLSISSLQAAGIINNRGKFKPYIYELRGEVVFEDGKCQVLASRKQLVLNANQDAISQSDCSSLNKTIDQLSSPEVQGCRTRANALRARVESVNQQGLFKNDNQYKRYLRKAERVFIKCSSSLYIESKAHDFLDGLSPVEVGVSWFKDADGDGYGDPASELIAVTAPGSEYTTTSDDCNDSDSAISPIAPEKVNGVDDNCNGVTDEPNITMVEDKNCATPFDENDNPLQIASCQKRSYSIDISPDQSGGGEWTIPVTNSSVGSFVYDLNVNVKSNSCFIDYSVEFEKGDFEAQNEFLQVFDVENEDLNNDGIKDETIVANCSGAGFTAQCGVFDTSCVPGYRGGLVSDGETKIIRLKQSEFVSPVCLGRTLNARIKVRCIPLN